MSRFDISPTAKRDVATMAGTKAELKTVAVSVANEAKRLVKSHRVANEIDVAVGTDELGPVARVNANHWTSWFLEGGTLNQPPQAYLRRALERGWKAR